MVAVEFHAKITDGSIDIPQPVRKRFSGEVHVIVFTEGADRHQSA